MFVNLQAKPYISNPEAPTSPFLVCTCHYNLNIQLLEKRACARLRPGLRALGRVHRMSPETWEFQKTRYLQEMIQPVELLDPGSLIPHVDKSLRIQPITNRLCPQTQTRARTHGSDTALSRWCQDHNKIHYRRQRVQAAMYASPACVRSCRLLGFRCLRPGLPGLVILAYFSHLVGRDIIGAWE